MRRIILILIKLYKFIGRSGLIPPVCRYWPNCSSYAEEAVRIHGARKGAWMSLCRILRCNPWSSGGIDA